MAKPNFYWWHGSDLADFFCEAQAKGLENVRIEFHPDRENPEKSMLFVRSAAAAESAHGGNGNGGHNFAHPCPPDCP